MALRNINFHHIFSRFLWQGDYYYYSDILFLLFLRNNHQFLPNIKLPVALNLIKKVISFLRQNGSIFKVQSLNGIPKLHSPKYTASRDELI